MRRLFALGLMLHGLAQTCVGTWSFEGGPALLITPLWLTACVGPIWAGFRVWSGPGFDKPARVALVAGSLASILLILLFWHPVFVIGLILDAIFAGVALRKYRGPANLDRSRVPVRFWARAARVGRLGFLGYLILVIAARPWHSRWGTSAAERLESLPGDIPASIARYRIDHAVIIQAPADSVWPWLLQLGQDRGGFYSYDWLERMIGDHIHNADRIVPEWQHREVGDLVRGAQPEYFGGRLGREIGWRITGLIPNRALILENWGAFVLTPVNQRTTRLYVRIRGDGSPRLATVPLAPLGLLIFEPAHFIMERAMLLGIRARAEGRGRFGILRDELRQQP